MTLRVNDEGKLAKGPVAATLSEAAQHASSLRAELRRRSTHPEVLRYCRLEILAKNPFHASLEAVKSVADRLRQLTGERLDGARLVDAVLTPGQGMAVNANSSGPELHRTVTNEELLELLTTLSSARPGPRPRPFRRR